MKILNALSRKNSDDLFNVTGYLLKTLKVNFTRDKFIKLSEITQIIHLC